jgi:hypothetical protein
MLNSRPNKQRYIKERSKRCASIKLKPHNDKGIEKIEFPTEMQDTFAKIYEKVLELKDIIKNHRASDSFLNSLIQKAFKGELV